MFVKSPVGIYNVCECLTTYYQVCVTGVLLTLMIGMCMFSLVHDY